jgi:hypothetical protein
VGDGPGVGVTVGGALGVLVGVGDGPGVGVGQSGISTGASTNRGSSRLLNSILARAMNVVGVLMSALTCQTSE